MSKKEPISLKDSLRIILWSLSINWKISKFITITSFLTRTYIGLSGLLSSYILARVIDSVIKMLDRGYASIESMYPVLLIFGIVQIVNILMDNLDRYINRYRSRVYYTYLLQFEYEKINSLGVQTVQLPSVSNKERVVHEFLSSLIEINRSIVSIFASLIRIVITSIIVFSFSFWIGFAVLIIAVISFFQNRHFSLKLYKWQSSYENIQEIRKTYNMTNTLSNPDKMDEVSLVGAFNFFDKKVKKFFTYFNSHLIYILRESAISFFFVDLLNVFVVIGGAIHILFLVINRRISVGDTTFYISSIESFYRGVSNLSQDFVYISDLVMKGKDIYDFFNLTPVVQDGTINIERLIKPPMIEIKNITFHYPNSKRNIFENFSLTINSGEKIAIVGENGAGKSTLVKLLCRIYDPQKGKILINGIDLKELTLNDWYKNVGVLFQDFNFYGALTVEENIYVGKSVKKINRERVIESAKNADAHDFIMKYKRGYQTVMSERFKGGIKPSKGQQQKIAIARFFYRDAPFAIFDEPTSAIDADAEYRIFNRIYNFFDNKTVMIISHRFSTVRNADSIFVLRDGKIIERGTHKELIGNDKVYADNFRKQAEGYN